MLLETEDIKCAQSEDIKCTFAGTLHLAAHLAFENISTESLS